MRRILAIIAVCAVAIGYATGVEAQDGKPATYRIDVVFDNARGLVPGQLAKVAGARVGEIENVAVTADHKARVQMRIDGRFAPFREDASCTIRPEGLIAENYVDCDPGTPDAEPLEAEGDEAPTVPVEQTTQPVNLTDLFGIWTVPTRERLSVLVNTLGLATVARGEDFNAILRRANPALGKARRVISILQRQRDELARTVDATSTILRELSPSNRRVGDLLRSAARVSSRTGARRAELAEAVRRLPALLDATPPALARLDALAEAGTPLLREVRDAAPWLNQLSVDVGPLARAAKPALRQLGAAFDQGTATARRAAPVTRALRNYARTSLPAAQMSGRVLTNLRDAGFAESFLEFIHNAAAASGRFDAISHILPAHAIFNACSAYATAPVEGCRATFSKLRGRKPAGRDRAPRPGRPEPQTPRPPADRPPRPDLPRLPRLPKLPGLPDVGELPPAVSETLEEILGGEPSAPPTPIPDLLDYLLG